MRKFRLHQLGDAHRHVALVDADQHGARRAGAGGVEDIEPRPVAVIDLEAEVRRRLDHFHVVVDGGNVDAAQQQRLADDLAEPAEADDEHRPAQAVGHVDVVEGLLTARREPAQYDDDQRRQHHRDDDDGGQDRVGAGVDQSDSGRRRVEHEGELAALRHQRGTIERVTVRGLEQPRHEVDADALHGHVGDDVDGDHLPALGDDLEVERHADGEEEQAEQHASERLDVRFELVPEGRFGKQHAGKKRAHRHRQAGKLHDQRRTEHHQQRGGGHDLARAGVGEDAEQRVEQVAPGDHQGDDGADADADLAQALGQGDVAAARRQEGDQRQQRHDHQVFEQKDRDDALALRRGDVAAFLQQLHDDGGRGQHEAGAGDEGLRNGKPSDPADDGQKQRAQADLQRTEAEDLAPQAP